MSSRARSTRITTFLTTFSLINSSFLIVRRGVSHFTFASCAQVHLFNFSYKILKVHLRAPSRTLFSRARST
jgi:hypothetical protein